MSNPWATIRSSRGAKCREKRSGTSTDPCCTPCSRGFLDENVFLTTTDCECAKITTGTRKRTTTQNQGKKKRDQRNFHGLQRKKAEDLLKYLQDYKSSCDFKGIDFEADLACMPKCESSWREVMLRPLVQKKSVAPERGIKEMGKDEYDKYIKQIEAQQALRKTGYSGIKEKIKTLRQEYIRTVNKASRSGCGR